MLLKVVVNQYDQYDYHQAVKWQSEVIELKIVKKGGITIANSMSLSDSFVIERWIEGRYLFISDGWWRPMRKASIVFDPRLFF